MPKSKPLHAAHIYTYLLVSCGVTNGAAAKRVGVAPSVVDRFVRRLSDGQKAAIEAARARRKEEALAEKWREAQELRDAGASLLSIAELYGVAPATVAQHTALPSCDVPLHGVVTASEREAILEAYQQESETTRSVARRFGISHDTVARLAKEAGISKPARRRGKRISAPTTRDRAALAMRQSGMKIREIAEVLGVSVSGAQRIVRCARERVAS